jgi:class 3 adenylate cyclase/tetratricopeptide (TPR) repeat protein
VIPATETQIPKHLAEKILASRHLLEGERKQVTVLFADIRGSTKLLEGLDPEVGQQIIDPILRIMMDSVHRYEGTVNQVLGDGIMAIFGAPLAHEDHALRACYASLAMHTDLRAHRERLGQSEADAVQIGIGLNTGEVVVRSIDNDLNLDYSALGHTTHLAARMQELAGAGISLITASTLREVEGFVQVRAIGPTQVKGVSRGVDVYELIAATPARTRVQAAVSRGLTPFVGRKTELEIFETRIQQTGAGRGQILALVGEPGMGKSRLVYEFTRFHLPSGWLVAEGASVSYGRATPYFPLIELLRRYFSISEGDDTKSVQDKVVTHLFELDSALRDTIAPILSLLSALPEPIELNIGQQTHWLAQFPDTLGAARKFSGMEPQRRRRYTLDALKRLFIRESQRQPLMLVFEDLHWIDSETQAFLDSLVENLPMARILLLVDYRPGYTHGWGNRSYYTQLRIDPLQPLTTEELLDHLLGKNKDLAALKALLIKRTDGNPFFAEETVRSLVESGILVGEKGAYRPGIKMDTISIPATVQNVVADRIDHLPVSEKHLLQTAAVIGVIVPYPLLHTVTDLDEEALQLCLTHLQAAEFVYESSLFPEREFTFKHALINEVAYGELVHQRRTSIHSQVVTALEQMTAGSSHDYLEKLAWHAFHGELWEKAVNYLQQGAAKASSRSANREAAELYRTSLVALQHLPQDNTALGRELDIRLELRNPLFLLGEFDELHQSLRAAEAIAERLGDHRRLGRVLNFLISYYGLIGEHGRAIDLGTRALQFNRGDLELNSVTQYYIGQAFHHMGQYEQSIKMLNQALYAINDERFKYERFGTANIISVICRCWLTQCFAQLGHFKDGIATADAGIKIAEENKHAYSLAYAHLSLGFALVLKGDIDEAIDVLVRSQKICEASDIKVLMTHVGSILGFAYALAGRLDKAIPLMENAEKQSELIGRRAAWSLRLTWLGRACFLAGQLNAARAHGQRALALATGGGERGYQAWALKLLGDIALEESLDAEQVRSHLDQSMELASQLSMQPLKAHLHLSLGRLHRRENQIEQAKGEIAEALALYSHLDMPKWLLVAERATSALSC